MKHIALICLLFLTSFNVGAQKIHFVDLNNSWIYEHDWIMLPGHVRMTERDEYKFTDSAFIDGHMFYKMWFSYVYEDTVKNIVYLNDTSHILFNYNWQVGDTFQLEFNGTAVNKIISIDTILINGYQHKVFNFTIDNHGYYTYTNYSIIEGIGNKNDNPMFPKTVGRFDVLQFPKLKCFSNKAINPYIDTTFGINLANSNCSDPFLSIQHIAEDDHAVQLYPQPADNVVTIDLPNVASGKFQLFTTLGQEVYTSQFKDERTLSIINNQWHGLYIYKISYFNTATIEQHTGKMIFQ